MPTAVAHRRYGRRQALAIRARSVPSHGVLASLRWELGLTPRRLTFPHFGTKSNGFWCGSGSVLS